MTYRALYFSSSDECIRLLGAKAIANSPELVILEEQIVFVDKL